MPLSYRSRTRYWIPCLFLIVFVGSWLDDGAHERAWVLSRAGLITYLLWQIVWNNGSAFEQLHKDKVEQLQTMQGTRIAAESLASTLEIILGIVKTMRAELAKNTSLTAEGAQAGAVAAQLALDTAKKLAAGVVSQRDTLAIALADDRKHADTARMEIKQAVADVQVAAKAAYDQANHVSDKFADVNLNIQQLNERLLEGEKHVEPPLSRAEASLHRIDAQTAAIEANTAATKTAIENQAGDIQKLKDDQC